MEKFCDRFLLVLTKIECFLCNVEVILLGFWGLKAFGQLFYLLDVLVKHFIITFAEFLEICF